MLAMTTEPPPRTHASMCGTGAADAVQSIRMLLDAMLPSLARISSRGTTAVLRIIDVMCGQGVADAYEPVFTRQLSGWRCHGPWRETQSNDMRVAGWRRCDGVWRDTHPTGCDDTSRALSLPPPDLCASTVVTLMPISKSDKTYAELQDRTKRVRRRATIKRNSLAEDTIS